MWACGEARRRRGARPVASLLVLACAIGGEAVAQQLNPTGRRVELAMPVVEEGTNRPLGEIPLRIDPDDTLSVPSEDLIRLLTPLVQEEHIARLRESAGEDGRLTPEETARAGFRFEYDPELLLIRIGIPAEVRGRTELSARALGRRRPPEPNVEPATLAAQINLTTQTGYVHRSPGGNEGFREPAIRAEVAVRFAGVVAETEVTADLETKDVDRSLTRLIADVPDRALRIEAGDLATEAVGFQAGRRFAGVAVRRDYGLLQPWRNVRPTGRHSFFLERPADVDLYVNGVLIRRFRLPPGPYDVRDFPLTIGANRVRLEIRDAAGGVEVLEFDLFFSNELLEPGRDEFYLGAGVDAPRIGGEPDYSRDPVVSGYYRRGVTDTLTLGANFQAGRRVGQFGIQASAATPFGNVGVDVAASVHDDAGFGAAAELRWNRRFDVGAEGRPSSLDLQIEGRTADFAALGVDRPANPRAVQIRGLYSHPLPAGIGLTVAASYAFGRGSADDEWSVGLALSRGFGALNVGAEFAWRDQPGRSGPEATVRLNYRFGPRDRIAVTLESRDRRVRAGYVHDGLGTLRDPSWSVDFERTNADTTVSGQVTVGNDRGEIGLDHAVRMSRLFGDLDDQRTNLRFETAVVFADGAVAVARRGGGGFALFEPHATLQGRTVVVEAATGEASRSGVLGPAVVTGLGAYTPRRILVDVEDLPPGYDLGTGSYDLLPPYRAGYRIVVGSAYNVSVLGTLLDHEGRPVSLVAGRAIELARPERPPVEIFTNAAGRFGAFGLAPGRWRIEMATEPPLVYEIEIPEGALGLLRLDALRPLEGEE